MLRPPRQRGFSLIELMVTLVIAGILMAAAVPAFSVWLTNSRIRNVTTEFYSGLQQARAEAIARNGQVRFQSVTNLTSSCSLSTGGQAWVINMVGTGSTDDVSSKCNTTPDPATTSSPFIIANRRPDTNTSVTVAASSSEVIFTSLGRRTTTKNTLALPASDATYDFSASSNGGCAAANGKLTCLRVIVSAAGQVRMCNPRFQPPDPQACPIVTP